MARFSSNKMLDMTDLKANGFTFGGAGLTLMSCWMAWWFSGGYPSALLPAGPAFLVLWTAVCAGTGGRAEIVPVGPGFAMAFKRTAPAVQRCKN